MEKTQHHEATALPENFRKLLAVALRSIQWSYAIFWACPPNHPGILKWVDGYYNGDPKSRLAEQDIELGSEEPSASLSPENLSVAQRYFVDCMSFVFNLDEDLAGRAFFRKETLWLCDAHNADSAVFSRSSLTKKASIQTVVCFPHHGGVLEIGTTELVNENLDIVRHLRACLDVSKSLCINFCYRSYHFAYQFRNGTHQNNNFLKAVKWSPDGSRFLTNSEDNTLRVFSLPDYNDGTDAEILSYDENGDSYAARILVEEGESVYDFCWFPHMNSSDHVSCVFATTTRDHPIHLWDAISGLLRGTYRAYDAVDEITAAVSLAFNPSGTKIYGGYNKCIRVFDIHRPGREFTHLPTLQGNKEGQRGIISSIAFSPIYNGMLATGSYDRTTAIYLEDKMELLYVLNGQEGGITHVQFSKDGNYLYTGGRKDPYILCWDVRNPVDVMYKLYRSSAETNQRIAFDIEPNGRYLGTGGQDGLVHLYDLQVGQWVSSFEAAKDTVNGFSFHPSLPMAVTSSGHRRFCVTDETQERSLEGDENCVTIWTFNDEYVEGEN